MPKKTAVIYVCRVTGCKSNLGPNWLQGNFNGSGFLGSKRLFLELLNEAASLSFWHKQNVLRPRATLRMFWHNATHRELFFETIRKKVEKIFSLHSCWLFWSFFLRKTVFRDFRVTFWLFLGPVELLRDHMWLTPVKGTCFLALWKFGQNFWAEKLFCERSVCSFLFLCFFRAMRFSGKKRSFNIFFKKKCLWCFWIECLMKIWFKVVFVLNFAGWAPRCAFSFVVFTGWAFY